MRYVSSATLVALSILAPAAAFGQLTITNYQLVSQQMVSLTTTNYTYTAQVANTGVPLASVTATATSLTPSQARFLPGLNTLTFGPVGTSGEVTSTNTFTIQVNRTITPAFTWADLQWTFQSTPAAPVANAGPNQPATVNETITLNGSGSTNPSGVGTLTYLWAFTSRPAGSSTILRNQTSVNPQFIVDVGGNYVIKLTVSNGVGSSSSTVTVSTTDTSPVANAGPNQTVAVGATVTLNGSGSTDANSDPLTFQWTILSVPSGSAATLTGATTVSPTFVADKAGSYVIQLVVNDGLLNSAPATVTITTGNTAPVANAGANQMVNLELTVQLDGSGSTDANSDPLTYSWSLLTVPTNSTATLSSTTAVKPTFVADLPGTYVVQLIVNDGLLSSAPSTVTITTNPPLAPTANAGSAQVISHFNTSVQLSGSGTDPQGLQLTYLWSFTSKPTNSTATLTGATTATPTFFADLPGTYTVQLIVNDGYLSSVPATVMITTDAAAPTANPGTAQSVPVGTTVTLSGSGSVDLNGESLTYAWSFNSKPNGSAATLTGATSVSPTFVPDVAGLYVVQLIVSDGFASSTPATVSITATQTAASITATSGTPQTAADGTAFAPLVVVVKDAGSNPVPNVVVTFAAPSTGPSGTFAGGVTTAMTNASGVATSATFTANTTVGAQYTVTATVPGVASPANFLLTNVAGGPASVIATSGTPQSATVGTAFGAPLVATVKDANGNPVGSGIVVTFLAPSSGPSGTFAGGATTAATNASGVATSAIFTANTTGGAQYSVTASATGASTSASFLLTNNPGAAASIVVTSGSGQSVAEGTAFAAPLVATVKDTNGNTVASGVTVTFTAPVQTGASGTFTGGLTTATANTNASGVATSPTFTANGNLGAYTVPATVTGVSTPANFSLTNLVGTAASISATSGGGQTTGLSSAFTSPLVATVKDSGGNVVPNVVVTFTAPSSGASGTFANNTAVTTATTNASGVATSAVFTANATTGTYNVSATATGVATAATYSMTNSATGIILQSGVTVTVGNSANLTVTLPIAAPAGGTIINVVSSNTNLVTLQTANFLVPAGSFTPNVTPKVTGVGFGTVTITATATGYSAGTTTVTAADTLSFSGNPMSITGPVTQQAFLNLSATAPAAGVVVNLSSSNPSVATVPSTATIAANTTSVNVPVTGVSGGTTVITASSAANNIPATTLNVTVVAVEVTTTTLNTGLLGVAYSQTLAATNGTTPYTWSLLSGTLPTGMTFSNTGVLGGTPTATTPQGGTALTFKVADSSSPQQTATATLTLTVLTGTPASITATGGTPQSAADTTAFGLPLSVTVKDANNNLVPNQTVTFTAPSSGASGTFAGGGTTATATTNSLGVATSPVFTANSTLGSYQVSATVSPVATAATFSLTNIAGSAATITVTSGSGQSATEGTAFANPLVVTVKDAGSNPVSGATVTFTVPGSGASGTFTTSNTATTTASGVATSNVFTANGTAGTYPVTAASGAATGASFSLTNNVGAPASVTVSSGSGQTAAANAAFTSPLVATVKDSGGNVLTGVSVTFTAPTQTNPSVTFTTANPATTNASGNASVSVTANAHASSTAYNVTATVTSSSLTPASFSLTNVTGAPASIVTTSGSGQTAADDTAFAAPLVATVKDSGGNPVSGATVNFTITPVGGASATFAGGVTSETTNASGVVTSAVLTANSTIGGPYTVTATVASTSFSTTFTLTNVVGAATTVAVNSGSGQSVAINTGFASALVAKVTDAGGNPVSGVTVSFQAPALTVASGIFTVPGGTNATTAVTNASGLATASQFTANATAGGPYNVTATVTGLTAVSFSLTNNPGAPASIAVNGGNSQGAAVGTAFTTPLSVIVKDAGGNLLSGVGVTFQVPASNASATFAGGVNTATTLANGVATSATLTANSTIGQYPVSAFVTATPSITTSFTLNNNSGPPASITATAGNSQSATVGTAYAQPLQVTVRDASSNPVAGITVTFTVPALPNAGGTFAGSVTTTTSALGVATSPVLTANTKAGPVTVTASIASPVLSTTFSLTNNAGAAAAIVATSGFGQSVAINTSFTNPLVATVTDSAGNPVSTASVTFTAPLQTLASATFGTNPAITGVAGTATTTVRSNSVANSSSYNVTATITGTSISTTFALTNNVGPAQNIAISSGNNQSAGILTAYTSPLAVTVTDAGGNLVPNAVVTFTTPLQTVASGTFFNGITTATTTASGVATSGVFTANAIKGSVAVGASSGSATLATPFSLTNTAGLPAAITVTSGSPQSAQIGAAFAPLSVTVKDSQGNTVNSGVIVTFTPPGAGLASGTFANGVNTAATTASGVATSAVFTANSTVGGPYNVAVTAITGSAPAVNFSLQNLPGNPAAITATGGTPQSATVGTAFGTSFSATVKDSGGNLVPGATVTFTVQPNGGATGSFTGPLTTTTALTSASGVATTSLAFTAGTVSGSYSVVATVSGVATGATFALTNNAGSPASITMTSGSNQSAQLQAAFTNPLVATVKDTNGNFVSGATVTFTAPASPNASGTFFGATNTVQVQTIANGTATSPVFTANTVVGGPYNVVATVTGVGTGATFSLQNLPGAPSAITVTSGSAQTAAVNTAFGQQFSVTIKDAGGNLVPNVVVTFTAPVQTGASGTFAAGANTATTSASGVATSAVFTANSHASTTAYNVVVSVTPGSAPTQNISLTNVPGQATTVTATSGTPQSAKISTAYAALVATVTDASGNPVLAGVNVTFTAPPQTGASGLFGGALTTTLPTNASGQVSTTLTANTTIGTFSVTAGVSGGTTSATYNLQNTAGNPANVTITSGNNQSATVATQFGAPLVVTVTDGSGNLVSGTPVLFTAPVAGSQVVGGTFTGGLTTATVNTTAQGVATSPAFIANSYASSPGTNFNVTATAGTGSATFSLTNNAGAPASIAVYSGSGQTQTENEQFSSPLEALVQDSHGNNITGATVTFTLPPVGGASASFAAGINTAVTSNGVAISNLLSADNLAGTYTINASVTGVSTKAAFTLTNSIVGSSGGTLSFSAVSGGGTTVGQNMQIVVQANLSTAYTCTGSQTGLNVNVSVDGVNLFVGSGVAEETLQIPCNSTAVDFYVAGGPNTGSFPITLSAPGYTTGTGTVTVAPSGFILSSDNTLPPSTTMSTLTTSEGLTSTIYVWAVQLNSNLTYAATGVLRSGYNASVPVTVVNTSLGTITTSPVVVQGGNNEAVASFTASSSTTGATNITAGQATGFNLPSGYTSIAVTVQASSIVVPNETVGMNLELPVQFTLNGEAQGTCGGFNTEPFTVQSSDLTKVLLSNSSTGQGTSSITVQVASCGSTSQPFYVQVVGGTPNQSTVNYTVSGAGFAMGTGTISVGASGFVIGYSGDSPGSVPYFNSVAGAGNPTSTLTVYSYLLDGNLNPSTPQNLAAGGSNIASVTVPVNVDNTTYGTVSPTTVVIPTGSLSGTTQFQGLLGGTGANPNIANISVGQPTTPTGFSTPASDTSIAAHITNPSFSLIDSGSQGSGVGQNLQGYGTVGVGVVQTTPLVVTLTVTTNPSAMLLSATGTDAGLNSIQVTIPAGASISPSFYIYGLAAGGSATYTAQAAGFNPKTSTIPLTPSGVALVGNFTEGGTQVLETSTTVGIASGTYVSGITATGTAGQTCELTSFTGPGTGVSATLTLTDTNTIAAGTALSITTAGSGYNPTGSTPTSAVASSGSATCTGTAVITTTFAGYTPFTVEVGQLETTGNTWIGPQSLMPTVSAVVNLSAGAGTIATPQVTIPGGQSQAIVGYTPAADGNTSITITSATNVSDTTGSSQNSMTVLTRN